MIRLLSLTGLIIPITSKLAWTPLVALIIWIWAAANYYPSGLTCSCIKI